jgi:hypothetical protein
MNNQTQRAMEPDFLEGIDDQFQRLMKLYGNGKRNGRSNGHSVDDRLILEIVDAIQGFSKAQKEQVLVYVQSLKQKVD